MLLLEIWLPALTVTWGIIATMMGVVTSCKFFPHHRPLSNFNFLNRPLILLLVLSSIPGNQTNQMPVSSSFESYSESQKEDFYLEWFSTCLLCTDQKS